jgi:cell division septal protein FtsQ
MNTRQRTEREQSAGHVEVHEVPTGRHRRSESTGAHRTGETTGRRRLVTRGRPVAVKRRRKLVEQGLSYALAALLVVGLPLGLYAALDDAATSRMFLVREVDIEGASLLSREQILAAAGLDVPRSALELDAELMESRIRSLAWVKDVDVTVGLTGHVGISLTEARLAGITAVNELYLVDTDGDLIRRWQPSDGLGSTLFVGFDRQVDGNAVLDREAWRAAQAMVHAFDASSLGEQLEVREIQRATANAYRLQLSDGTELRIADDHLVARLDRFAEARAEFARLGVTAEYVVLDGDDLGQVVYKERSQAALTGAAKPEAP